ncbi:hypothetical protein H4582DRAFT_2084597 [Lactarius indigo]|nr:hypothetical protein H4582DRAFT_2084597 [Lactarius indigo]
MPSTDEDTTQQRTTRNRKNMNKQKKGSSQQAKPASATNTPPVDGSNGAVASEEDENEVKARIEKAKEELKALEAQKEALSKELTEKSAAAAASLPKIERPPKGMSIQKGMELSDDKPRYDAIRHLVRDLVAEVGIDWEVSWAKIPASKKARLYHAARKAVPYLKRFANDWATQLLAMQLLKNKRAHSYRRGYLKVPEQYAYLKNNAAKRYPQGRRNAEVTPVPQSDVNARLELAWR